MLNGLYSNRISATGYFRLRSFDVILGIEPSSGHLHGPLPSPIHLGAVLSGYFWLEGGAILTIDFLQLVEFLPDVNSKAGCNGGP